LQQQDLVRSCLEQPIDWEYLLDAAGKHNVTSLLYWHLNGLDPNGIPPKVLERLHAHYVGSAKNNLFLTAELLRILELFNTNKIQAIPFKGPVLALTLYEDPGLREFIDLDILVQKQDVFKALGLLHALGYRKAPDYSLAEESQILERDYHYHLEHGNGRNFVEIHWNILARHFLLPLSIDRWWARAGIVSIQSRQVPNLSAEDLLMALCAHGCKHMWKSLSWIIDITKLLTRNPDLNWDFVFREYSTEDLCRIIFLGLNVASLVLDAGIPAEILKKSMCDSAAVELARQVQTRLFQHHGERGGLRFMRFQYRMKSRRIDGLRFCFRVISTPSLTEGHGALHQLSYPLNALRRLFPSNRE
jgi:hypothetical protein